MIMTTPVFDVVLGSGNIEQNPNIPNEKIGKAKSLFNNFFK